MSGYSPHSLQGADQIRDVAMTSEYYFGRSIRITCTVISKQSGWPTQSFIFLDVPIPECYLMLRAGVHTILIGTLIAALRNVLPRQRPEVPDSIAALISGHIGSVTVATTRVPSFEDGAYEDATLSAFRSLGPLDTLDPTFELADLNFEWREVVAVNSDSDATRKFLGPLGVPPETHFILIFTTPSLDASPKSFVFEHTTTLSERDSLGSGSLDSSLRRWPSSASALPPSGTEGFDSSYQGSLCSETGLGAAEVLPSASKFPFPPTLSSPSPLLLRNTFSGHPCYALKYVHPRPLASDIAATAQKRVYQWIEGLRQSDAPSLENDEKMEWTGPCSI